MKSYMPATPTPTPDREVARAIELRPPVLDAAGVDEEPQLAVAEGHPVEEVVIDLGVDRLPELEAGERDALAEPLVDRHRADGEVAAERIAALVRDARVDRRAEGVHELRGEERAPA